MPTTIAIRFPWGRYHGTPWGRNVNEGVADWPPEPWRLLRALYATWRSRAPELSEDMVLPLLDALADPPELVVPPHRTAHTRHYLPDARYGVKGGGTDKVFDTFAVVERDAELVVTWPRDLHNQQREALATLCERLTYVGRADSICTARLVQREADVVDARRRGRLVVPANEYVGWGDEQPEVLAAHRPVTVEAMEARPQQVRRSGRRDPSGTCRVRYRDVDAPSAGSSTGTDDPMEAVGTEDRIDEASALASAEPPAMTAVTAVRFRMTAPALPNGPAALAMTDALRQAVVRRFDPAGTGRTSIALFGKGPGGERADTGHEHAHYLAFASGTEQRRSRRTGRPTALDTLVVWAPMGLSAGELEALVRVQGLWGREFAADFRPCRLAVEALGTIDHVAPELFGKSKVWESFTPYAPPRHIRRQDTWIDHAKACLLRDIRDAGLPEPHAVDRLRSGPGSSSNRSWRSYRRHRLKETLADARRATGLIIEFPEEVEGPLVMGALRHFGLGLFLPLPNAGPTII